METIPDDVFLGMFYRINVYVRMGHVTSLRELKKRFKNILSLQKRGYQRAQRSSTIIKFRRDFRRLRKAYRNKMPERIWREAQDDPTSIYGLTLKYGFRPAIEIRKDMVTPRRMRRVR